jgi:histidinol dehydrogenase
LCRTLSAGFILKGRSKVLYGQLRVHIGAVSLVWLSIEVSEQGAQILGKIASVLAHGEGLQAHARAAEMRLKGAA